PAGYSMDAAPVSRKALFSMGVVYLCMILSAIGALYLICKHGQSLSASTASALKSPAQSLVAQPQELFHVLIALLAVIVTGLILGKLCTYVGQPPVIGEVLAGIVLGPSLLGPSISALILPPSVAPFLGVISQLGVILYMFIVGLDLR